MSRKRWQRPQTLNLSYATEQSYDIYDDENEPSTLPKVPCFSPPPNLVMVSENLNLAPFSKRAVVDFGDFLTVGLHPLATCVSVISKLHPYRVHCKRYPNSDEFTLSWLLTTKEKAENLPDPETQALIDTSASPISLISSQTIHLGPHGDCLLRVIWTPKSGPLPSVLGAKVSRSTKLRHVLQFRFSGAAVVEAILVATSVKQPTRGGKKVWKRPHNILCHRNGSREYSSTRSVFRSYPNSNHESTERGTFLLPLSTLNMDLNGNVIERGKSGPVSHCSTSAQSVEANLRPSRPSEVSLAAGKRRLMRSSSGLRALAAFMTSRDRHRSQSLDMRDAVSVLAAEDFRTPRRSISTANDLQRTPENEATSFISPALLSPVVKRDTNIIFATGACRSGTSSTAVTSTTSINNSSANIFGWDASAALSAANETGFTRWLNHLFASGQITRSSVSDGDPANRAEGPRAALLRLLHSPTFTAPAHRIEREIDGQRLVVNRDLNFRDDKGLQRCICDLFTSHYASVWLSLCVDVLTELVQSTEAPMAIVGKASALSRRVHRCLFADVPPLPKKKGTKKKANSAGEHEADPMLLANWKSVGATSYTEHYNQQIVKRCLTLIWLLDQAKMKRVLRLDPCLFNVSAPVKSSVEVCQSLGRIYLSRETNLARSLAILGANLSVVQKPLDEFDFTVTNLAVDLRDGLRLVKLADLLLPDSRTIFPAHNGSLMSLVRFPAISRLQKIHNVQLALSAFETVAGRRGLCTAAGKPITERDIVNGHRAKTLSLLWFILLRFQVTALLDPPALRSEISRLTATNVSLRRDVEALLMANPSLSACGDEGNNPLVEMECNQRILFVWARAVCFSGGYDEDVKVENLDQSFSDGRVFCYILHFYLPTLLPRGLVRGATTQTAHLHPDIPHPLLLRNNVANLRLFQQRLWHLGDVPMLLNVGPNLPTTANTITPNFTTADVNHHPPSAILPPGIVLTTLAYLASRLICGKGGGSSRLRRIVENHAARIIQTRWRQNRATQGSQFRPKSVVSLLSTNHNLCSSPSTNTSMEMEVGETVTANASEKDEVVVSTPATVFTKMGVIEAAVRIQRAVRAWLEARRRCRQRQCFVVEVQAQARAFLARQRALVRQQQALETQVDAAVVIQSMWRAYAARRRFIDLRSSLIRLQAFCRGVLARRAFQTTLATRSAAAVVIQRWWRYRQQRRQFLLQRQVVCLIQRRWRSTLAYRTRLRLAVQLQAAARAYLVRRDVAMKMHAILTLQKHMRKWWALCRERTTAACIIQRWWCAVKQRRAFLRTLHAVRRIQHWWRGFLKRQREVAAAIAIQRAWRWSRVRHQRRVEEGLRQIHIMQTHATAATTIQRAWRRFEVRRQRQRLANAAAGTIQRAWRTYRQKKQSVVEEERAAYVIQRNWRASGLQRWLHRRWRAAIVIQSAWRGYRVRCSGGSTAATVRRRLSEATQEARTRPHNTLGARASCALANLLRYTSVASVLDALGHLETSTRLSREVCLWLLTTPTSTAPTTVTSQCGDCGGCDENAEYLPHILLRLLHLCNRSVPDEEVALAAVAVMLNLTVAVDSSDVGTLEMWWQRRVLDEGGSSQSESIVEFLFGSLHRLSRAKPGTSSLRLFARIAALLAILCEALPPDFALPTDYVGEVETLLSLVQRLWSNALSRLPVRPEVRLLLRRHQVHESRRDLLRRLVTLELNLERLPSKSQVNPLTACEFLLLTLREHQRRHKHYLQLKQKHEG
ncbi:abnormal spindle microcephaly associated [Echinococcus multilocularis]|uniref:Abnormal spindle microcephaly associated n=1 Tax=Echinococcus multilocularis TaxID=6211 RepID=A0A068Y0D7_ECHMU|nr:abnormal spindle microcephaly associated [Echinococcus multilocularis]